MPPDLSEAQESCATRASASEAGSRRLAPEVLVLANVELDPETPDASELRFSENAPDSAARESEATGPAPSLIIALGSLT